jgi:hypothetical protein
MDEIRVGALLLLLYHPDRVVQSFDPMVRRFGALLFEVWRLDGVVARNVPVVDKELDDVGEFCRYPQVGLCSFLDAASKT